MSFRIYLSPPDVGELERKMLLEAFDSGWIAPVGPDLDAFEADLAVTGGVRSAVALSSGTAGLHLTLLALGVGAGDEVVVPTLTFAATANAVMYLGATPVFLDVDESSWTLSVELLAAFLAERAAAGRLPAAVVTVDLYGQCCDYDPIAALCAEYGVALVADAAEALGASYHGRPAGSFGRAAVFSFNGNKIITTSGGGAVVSDDDELVRRIRHLSTQAREPVAHYEHRDVGYNYRMSNLLAALGRAQLAGLDDKIARRRAVRTGYEALLGDVDGLSFMPVASYGSPNHWLTCIRFDRRCALQPEAVRLGLQAAGIEARPIWKPMHLQPVFSGAEVVDSGVAAQLFAEGLCLPSGSALTDADVAQIASLVRSTPRS